MFLNGIRPKVNITAQLEFEPCYFEVLVHYINHYNAGTSNQLLFRTFSFEYINQEQ